MASTKTMAFTAVVVGETEEGFNGFSASIPSLPGCYSQGETVEEALANLTGALTGYIESLASRNLPLPLDEQVFSTVIKVPVPA